MTILRVGAEQFRRQLTELLNRVAYGGDYVVVERHHTPIAVVAPVDTLDLASVNAFREPAVEYAPAEVTARMAEEIEKARIEADLSYEEMAEGMLAERLRTLREKYPDFILNDARTTTS